MYLLQRSPTVHNEQDCGEQLQALRDKNEYCLYNVFITAPYLNIFFPFTLTEPCYILSHKHYILHSYYIITQCKFYATAALNHFLCFWLIHQYVLAF